MQELTTGNITVQRDSFPHIDAVRDLNRRIFGEERLINRLDHEPMVFLTAHCEGKLAGFKIGYALSKKVFYSAKGATSPEFRRCGVATLLLKTMMHDIAVMGFTELQYDTFPALYPGMIIIGFRHGFRIKSVDWNPDYGDFQMRLAREF